MPLYPAQLPENPPGLKEPCYVPDETP